MVYKLKLVKGKSIIFVGDIDRCYRLKLFLEQFGIKSCVLNSELPVNSRIHVVEEFNKNIYDIIIASDELEVLGLENRKARKPKSKESQIGTTRNGEGDDDNDEEKELTAEPAKKKRKTVKVDKEYGVSRGIDFKNVACVLNFDLPTSAKSYTHRIGRTARAGKTGMALSFVVPKALYRKHKATSFPTAEHDEDVLASIMKSQTKKGKDVKDYHFDMAQVDSFRYRMNDALRAVTKLAIRQARTRELRQELLKSEKLKRHFEENPEDLHHLRHDGESRVVRLQPHLRHVPDYLMPEGGKQAIAGTEIGFVGFKKDVDKKTMKGRTKGHNVRKGKRVLTGKRVNPLKTFKAKGR